MDDINTLKQLVIERLQFVTACLQYNIGNDKDEFNRVKVMLEKSKDLLDSKIAIDRKTIKTELVKIGLRVYLIKCLEVSEAQKSLGIILINNDIHIITTAIKELDNMVEYGVAFIPPRLWKTLIRYIKNTHCRSFKEICISKKYIMPGEAIDFGEEPSIFRLLTKPSEYRLVYAISNARDVEIYKFYNWQIRELDKFQKKPRLYYRFLYWWLKNIESRNIHWARVITAEFNYTKHISFGIEYHVSVNMRSTFHEHFIGIRINRIVYGLKF